MEPDELFAFAIGTIWIIAQWLGHVIYNNFFEILIVFLLFIIAENTSR